MAVKDARDLFIQGLREIHSAEKLAVRGYPRLAKAVSSTELKGALHDHLAQTKGQLERLDRVFEILDKRAGGKTCDGMKGLLKEAAEHVDKIKEGAVLDLALIAALQRVEHYEIAAYGTAATLAKAMEQTEIHDLLAGTLAEEEAADGKFTEIAANITRVALSEGKNDNKSGKDHKDGKDDEEAESEDDDSEDDDLEDPQPAGKSERKADAKNIAKSSTKKAPKGATKDAAKSSKPTR